MPVTKEGPMCMPVPGRAWKHRHDM